MFPVDSDRMAGVLTALGSADPCPWLRERERKKREKEREKERGDRHPRPCLCARARARARVRVLSQTRASIWTRREIWAQTCIRVRVGARAGVRISLSPSIYTHTRI